MDFPNAIVKKKIIFKRLGVLTLIDEYQLSGGDFLITKRMVCQEFQRLVSSCFG